MTGDEQPEHRQSRDWLNDQQVRSRPDRVLKTSVQLQETFDGEQRAQDACAPSDDRPPGVDSTESPPGRGTGSEQRDRPKRRQAPVGVEAQHGPITEHRGVGAVEGNEDDGGKEAGRDTRRASSRPGLRSVSQVAGRDHGGHGFRIRRSPGGPPPGGRRRGSPGPSRRGGSRSARGWVLPGRHPSPRCRRRSGPHVRRSPR